MARSNPAKGSIAWNPGQTTITYTHNPRSRGSDSFIPTKLNFTRDVAAYRNLREGPIQSTGNKLDIAIKGEGYLVVETPNGDRYTRAGRMQANPDGQLVTQHGHPVLSDAGAPFFFGPEDEVIDIGKDGTVSTNNGVLGKLRLVRFDNEQNLTPEAGGLLSTDQLPQDVEDPHVVQGAIEGSNVEPILELTRMIDVHRAYDSVRRFIDGEDQRQRKLLEATRQTA